MASTETSPYWQPITQTQEVSQWVTGLSSQFKQAEERTDLPLQLSQGNLQTCLTTNSFWLIYRFGAGGRLAIRTCFDPQSIERVSLHKKSKTALEYHLDGSLGLFRVHIELPDPETTMLLRYTASLEPRQDFTVQAFPPDLYLLDDDNEPAPEGLVFSTQDGPTAGIAFLSVSQPVAGTILYFQNLTALNDYCQMTQTDPSGTVSVRWPEAGFTLPVSDKRLNAGKEVVLSDAFMYLKATVPSDEFVAADQFLEGMACIYDQLPKPPTDYYDWPKAAGRTIESLTESPDCGRTIKKQFYVNAYVGAVQKPPESMVQMAILVPLWEYQNWLGKAVPLVEQIQKNVPTFYDEGKGAIVRWLPGEPFRKETSEEEDPNKIDSWYLLHILMNLGRLADQGNVDAKEMLFKSIDFVIDAAHHFNYEWPVFYDIRTLTVIKAETSEGEGGELDVAGLYTHVMIQAYELSKDLRYLNEATNSAEKLRGKGFNLLYQSNITLMSALALAKLWKLTGNRLYYDLSKLGVANVIARMWIWECSFGFGQARSTFMGVAPLKGAEYVAAYEEAEIFATMVNYLKGLGQDVPAPIRLFFSEYIKYLLHRGRFYFPNELPADMVSQQPREGFIVSDLPIPLEDISTGWKQAGTVGQEVYGGALAYIMTTYAYKQFGDVPLIFFCDYPVTHADYQLTDKDQGYATFRLGGPATYTAQLRLIAKGRQLPQVRVVEDGATDQPLEPIEQQHGYQTYHVPGNQHLRVEWQKKA